MITKIFLGLLFIVQGMLYAPSAFSEENTVIINNEASATQQQAITAPALVPSGAKKLRELRERQEISTEDAIMKKLEKQRLLDEEKRADKLLGNSVPESSVVKTVPSSKPVMSFFGQKSFISLGAGFVGYPGVENINSFEYPAMFFSYGGYGYGGRLIFDLSYYPSRHYLKDSTREDIREILSQHGLSMSVKYSLLSGQMKPYVGLSSALVLRRWGVVNQLGEKLDNDNNVLSDVGVKTQYLALDSGVAVGADVAVGDSWGLNFDVRYHFNLYTENRKTDSQVLTDEAILDERESLIVSGNFRYYF